MHFDELDRGELIAVVGGIVLGISLSLVWYRLGNGHAALNDCKGPNGTCSGWKSLSIVRYFLLVTALAPLILSWIILRGHGLSWPRGELTAVTALSPLRSPPRGDRQAGLCQCTSSYWSGFLHPGGYLIYRTEE